MHPGIAFCDCGAAENLNTMLLVDVRASSSSCAARRLASEFVSAVVGNEFHCAVECAACSVMMTGKPEAAAVVVENDAIVGPPIP